MIYHYDVFDLLLQNPLQYNLQPVWLPYTCIDQLRIALKDGDIDTSYTEVIHFRFS